MKEINRQLLNAAVELQDATVVRHVKQQTDAEAKFIYLDGFDPVSVVRFAMETSEK